MRLVLCPNHRRMTNKTKHKKLKYNFPYEKYSKCQFKAKILTLFAQLKKKNKGSRTLTNIIIYPNAAY